MAKWNPLALKLVMWLMGILIAAGSAAGFIGGSFFQFDQSFGVTASVAGIAFGAGLMIAGFDPIANVSWVRALIVYAILQVVYQFVSWLSIGRFDVIPFVIAIIAGALLVVLYPNKPELWMAGTFKMPSGMGGGMARSKM
ncbi:MAG TPA: hypothetical protein VEQ13_05895 [Methylomirabilota bacterium]|nr:hypothetical protein [Methylomirabilota bacterium]